MITLVPTRLHWINDDGNDDPFDMCAHSPIQMDINGVTLVTPEDGDATVSASAIYLLRTLENDHTKASPVGDQLFPCCGHGMFDTGDEDVVICGCSNGSNVLVKHTTDGGIELESTDGRRFELQYEDWRNAVVEFSDAVRSFYDSSLPKTPSDTTEGEGFQKMLSEWNRRRLDANA